MPQLDIYTGMSQVFWFTIVFVIFYLFIVRDVLPALARSIKLRQKKVGGGNLSSLDDEAAMINSQTGVTLEKSLKDSRVLLTTVSTSSSQWLDSSLSAINENALLTLNKSYIKTIGELKGRSFLLEQTINKK